MKMQPRKVFLIGFFTFAVLINTVVISFVYNQGNLAPSNSSASKITDEVLSMYSGSTTLGIQKGDRVFVSIVTAGSYEADVSELFIGFDPKIFQGSSIYESSNVLALDKNIDNVSGKISVTLNNAGPGKFLTDSTLITLEFILLDDNVTSTKVRLLSESTFGAPNVLSVKTLPELSIYF
jgi:hypothetical protein